jgi:hypothetical protein
MSGGLAHPAAGIWQVTIETPAGNRTGRLQLETDGRVLTGFMSDGERHMPIADGRIDGDELHWTAKISKPLTLSLKFTATIDGDRISGIAKHFLGKARFTGTRA